MLNLLGLAICILLAACSVVDARTRRIPNGLVVAIGALAAAHVAISGAWHDGIGGLLFPSIVLLAVSPKLRTIGAGDLKLLSVIGLWVGWALNTAVLVLGCVLALLYAWMCRLRTGMPVRSVPFAPFLSVPTVCFYLASVMLT